MPADKLCTVDIGHTMALDFLYLVETDGFDVGLAEGEEVFQD